MKKLVVLLLVGMNFVRVPSATTGSKKVFRASCEDLNCENDNPCQTVSHDTTGEGDSAECICQGRWTGRRCELEIILKVLVIREYSVKFEILTRDSNNMTIGSSNNQKYTIKYWSNSSEHACLLVQDVTSTDHVIDGLSSESRYTFCSEPGFVDFCEVSQLSQSLPSNCVSVTTQGLENVSNTSNFMKIAVSIIVIFIIAILIIVVVIILLRKFQPLTFNILIQMCHRCRNRSSKFESSSHNVQASVLLSGDTPIYKHKRKKELPPSKQKSRFKKRAKTYCTAPEGNQTLATLIEDNEDAIAVTETSLVEAVPLQKTV